MIMKPFDTGKLGECKDRMEFISCVGSIKCDFFNFYSFIISSKIPYIPKRYPLKPEIQAPTLTVLVESNIVGVDYEESLPLLDHIIPIEFQEPAIFIYERRTILLPVPLAQGGYTQE